MKKTIEEQENLTVRQAMVDRLIVEDGSVKALLQTLVQSTERKRSLLTTGTYLRGKIIIGELAYESGPNNMQPSVNLSDHLKELGLKWFVLKQELLLV